MRHLALWGLLVTFAAVLPLTAQAQASIECGQPYTVKAGDSLSLIAKNAYGDGATDELYRQNADRIGPNPDIIRLGMQLRMPCGLERNITIDGANFQPAPEIVASRAIAISDNTVNIVFNKASAPKFILNVGIIDPFLEDIERVTEGRVQFLEPAVVDRDPQNQLDLVQSGDVDGAYVFNGYLADTHPLVQITMQPMVGGTALQTAIALWRVQEQHFYKANNFDGVKLLGFIGAPPAHIWRVSDVPVTEQEQLQDNNAWAVPYFEGLDTKGAQVMRTENADRIRLLDQTPGLPPATFALAHGAARAVGVWTQARTVTEIDGGVYAPTFSVVISEEKWNEISPRDQAAIERLSGETLALRSAAWDSFDNGHKEIMLREGLNIVQADVKLMAELQDRARVGWEAWMATAETEGVSGFEALEAFFAEMERLRRQYPG